MLRQVMMQSGDALESEEVASVESQAGSDIAYAISMAGALSLLQKRRKSLTIAKMESDNPSHGRKPAIRKIPQRFGNKGVEERRNEKSVLVEGELLLHVHQTGDDREGLCPADEFQIIETQIDVTHRLGTTIEHRNKSKERDAEQEKPETPRAAAARLALSILSRRRRKEGRNMQ